MKIVHNTVQANGCFCAATAKASAAYSRTFNGTQRLDIILGRLLTVHAVMQQDVHSCCCISQHRSPRHLPSLFITAGSQTQVEWMIDERRDWRSPSPFSMVSHKPLTSQMRCWQHDIKWGIVRGVEAAIHWASGPQFSDRLITRWTCSVCPTDTDTDRCCSWHTERRHDEARMARYRVRFT